MLHNIGMRLSIIFIILLTFVSGCKLTSTREADEAVTEKIQREEDENARLLKAIDAHVGIREYGEARKILQNSALNRENIKIQSRATILNAYFHLESGKPGKALNMLYAIHEEYDSLTPPM